MAEPDRMFCCRACAQSDLLPRLVEPRRAKGCDACGRSSAKTRLGASTVHVGALMLLGNICHECNSPSNYGWTS